MTESEINAEVQFYEALFDYLNSSSQKNYTKLLEASKPLGFVFCWRVGHIIEALENQEEDFWRDHLNNIARLNSYCGGRIINIDKFIEIAPKEVAQDYVN